MPRQNGVGYAIMAGVPATFLSHQAAVLPLKQWRPTWFDGVALVLGSMAPDFAYALQGTVDVDAHRLRGALVFAVPLTVVLSYVLRSRVATVGIPQLPDAGPLQLRSWAVIGRGRPRLPVTLCSAFLGVFSHVVWDSFTHRNSRGSTALGLNGNWIHWGGVELSGARTLQAVSHVVGAAVTLTVMARLVHSGYLERHHGAAAVVEVRAGRLRGGARLLFWVAVGAGTIAGWVWAQDPLIHQHTMIIRVVLGAAAGMAAGAVLASFITPPATAARAEEHRPAAVASR
jgi:hypothetical protein